MARVQEQRGASFGVAFALLALIQSDLLKQPVSLLMLFPTPIKWFPWLQDDVAMVTERLVTAASKKTYLGEFVGAAIVKLIRSVPEEVVLSHILPLLGLDCGWEGCSPDKLLVLAELQKTVGKVHLCY